MERARQAQWTELQETLAEVSDLNRASLVLTWDLETHLPPGGVTSRAQQIATLRRLAHERFTADRVGELLAELEEVAGELERDSEQVSLVRVTRRDFDLSRRLSPELVSEVAKAGATGRSVWATARMSSDYQSFLPYLEHNIQLNREVADCLGYRGRRYDALIDRAEPGLTTAQLEVLFGDVKAAVVPMIQQIRELPPPPSSFLTQGEFDQEAQLEFAIFVAQQLGYDLDRGRQDLSAHPFCIGFGPGDVRITTRVDSSNLTTCLFSSIHEAGHAMYNQGIAAELDRTPLWGGASPGVHESQSRLWENLVGRSRPFWRHFFPSLQSRFSATLDGVDAETFYRAVNRVQPSLIRVDADELTYNLHILMRFELETDLLEERLAAPDLPEAWNQKLLGYLGVEAPDHRLGALQDIHWSGVSFGGFPSYTLGNLIGSQVYSEASRELGNLDADLAAGDFGRLRGWLVQNVYRHGRKFTPGELIQKVTGQPLSAGPWIDYVRSKYSELYNLRA